MSIVMYNDIFSAEAKKCTAEIFRKKVSDKHNNWLNDQYRKTGDKEKYKKKLPAFSTATSDIDEHVFEKGADREKKPANYGKTGKWRDVEHFHLNPVVTADFDHCGEPKTVFNGVVERLRTLCLDKDDNGVTIEEVGFDWPFDCPPEPNCTLEELFDYAGIFLIFGTASGEGLKVCFKARWVWGNVWDNQQKMAKLLGLSEYLDDNCKSPVHTAFFPKSEDIFYLNDELFTYSDRHYVEKWEEKYRNGEVSYDNEPKKVQKKAHHDDNVIMEEDDECDTMSAYLPTTFMDIPYTDIVDEYFRQNGGLPQVGERNTRLHTAACNLKCICDNNQALLRKILPDCGLPQSEMSAIVSSACETPPKGFTKAAKQVLAAFGVQLNGQATDVVVDAGCESTPPDLPQKLPKLVKLLLSNTPEIYKPAVANAIFPPLAAHVHSSVCFEYLDHEMYEAALSDITMGETGAGKSCVNKPIAHIMADIRERDKVNLQRERDWREDCNGKDKNPPRPKGLVIQECVSDMTPPTITLRLSQNEGWPIYLGLNELTLLENLKGQSGRQHHELILASFDRSLWGQMRVGAESVNDVVKAAVIINASTTLKKGREFFRTCSTDGEISRLTFSLVPEQPIGADIPVFGKYTDKFDEQLKPYIDNLVAARDEVKCPQANSLIKKLMREVKDIAIERGDRTYDNLSRRACVIAWLKALVLYIANGYHWEKAIEDFTRWSLHYDLWCKMAFFSYDIEKTNSGADAKIGSRGPRSLLPLLPSQFNMNDAKRMRQAQGLDVSDALTKNMLKTWINRGYIKKLTDCSYQKCG